MAGGPHRSGALSLRVALAASVAATAVAAAGALDGAGAAAGDGAGERPNIVVVITDDQPLHMFNRRVMPTTHRALAKGGTTFTDAVVSTPLCCPARASFLTGQYTHNHGAWNSYRTLASPRQQLASWLSEAGYRTGMVGKYLNHYEDVAGRLRVEAGWDRWWMLLEPLSYYGYDVAANGRLEHRGSSAGDYSTTYLNRQAVRLVSRWAPKQAPFFLWYAPHAPHDEKRSSRGPCAGRAVPAPGDEDLFRDAKLPRPPSFNEGRMQDKPRFMRRLPRLRRDDFRELELRYRCRLASLREVDRGVGEIVRELRDRNELDETIVVFTSDNGLFHGEHRLRDGKRLAYAEAVEVPFLARVPGPVARGPTASKVGQPVANIDLAPTLLELAGAEPCTGPASCTVMDGRSLVSLIRGDASGWPVDRARALEMRNCRFTGVIADERIAVKHISVPRKPTRRGCINRDAWELYDSVDDPYQLRSKARSRRQVPRPLRQRLDSLKDCLGIEGRDPPPPVGLAYCE